MKTFFVFYLLIGLTLLNRSLAQNYQQLHKDILVVDGHNDVSLSMLMGRDIGLEHESGHTDIPRLEKGGVDVQVFAVWSNDLKWKKDAFKHANEQIDTLENTFNRNRTKIQLAHSSGEVEQIVKSGKIAALIGVESGNMIENSISNLEVLYARGARYLTLTWNYNLPWATAAAVEDNKPLTKQKGLSRDGRKIIRKMNKLGMMVDLSHASKKTFYDVMRVSSKPVLVSHSNAAALTPHFRNLDDEQLVALKKNGGVVGVNFYSGFLDSTYNTRLRDLFIEQFGIAPDENEGTWTQYDKLSKANKHQANAAFTCLLQHIDYLVQVVGINHVALGSDFDGIESPPQGLEDVSKFPQLTKALGEKGYSKEDIAKIMGLNFLRVLKENEN